VGDRVRAAAGRAELVVQEIGRAELVGDGAVAGGEASSNIRCITAYAVERVWLVVDI
jgi:hypothetical protein